MFISPLVIVFSCHLWPETFSRVSLLTKFCIFLSPLAVMGGSLLYMLGIVFTYFFIGLELTPKLKLEFSSISRLQAYLIFYFHVIFVPKLHCQLKSYSTSYEHRSFVCVNESIAKDAPNRHAHVPLIIIYIKTLNLTLMSIVKTF